MRFFLSFMLLLGVVSLVGCDTGQVEIPEATTDSTAALMKPILERVAETGDLSIAEELQSYIDEDLAETDPAKADTMKKEFDELMALSSPNEIKAKAQDMISKL